MYTLKTKEVEFMEDEGRKKEVFKSKLGKTIRETRIKKEEVIMAEEKQNEGLLERIRGNLKEVRRGLDFLFNIDKELREMQESLEQLDDTLDRLDNMSEELEKLSDLAEEIDELGEEVEQQQEQEE